MARNPRIVVFGEDVADASRHGRARGRAGKGGVFKVTHGLQRQFGDDRVFNAPLAEASIIGRAIGMATRGLKPVVEIQFFDYIWPAMMQLRDEMSMLRYRSANHFSCPMVDPRADRRLPARRRRRITASRARASSRTARASASRYPSNARRRRRACCARAIRCDDPVLFLEHKHLYRQTYNKASIPGQDFMMPFGKASLRRDGTDVLRRHLGRARAALARGGAPGREARASAQRCSTCARSRPTTGEPSRAASNAHEPRRHRPRGSADVRLRRRDRGANRQRPLPSTSTRLSGGSRALDTPVAYCPDLEEAILPQSVRCPRSDSRNRRSIGEALASGHVGPDTLAWTMR